MQSKMTVMATGLAIEKNLTELVVERLDVKKHDNEVDSSVIALVLSINQHSA